MNFIKLWSFKGRVDRFTYFLIGWVAFLIKYNLSRFVALVSYDIKWFITEEVKVKEWVFSSGQFSDNYLQFLVAYFVLSIPFIYLGLAMTIKRLRALGWPLYLCFFFFIPYVNLGFFLLLSVYPSKPFDLPTGEKVKVSFFDRFIPENSWGSANMAVIMSLLVGLLAVGVSVDHYQDYGWALFFGGPFLMGMLSTILHCYHGEKSFVSCIGVVLMSLLLTGAMFWGLAFEGAICLAMALPLAFIAAFIGVLVAYFLSPWRWKKGTVQKMTLLVFLITPFLISAESAMAPPAPLFKNTTTIVIEGTPEQVWKKIVAFSDIEAPKEFIFQIGIAYPKKAVIHGQGVGAIRDCVFSTGKFVEPIEVWDEPKLLKFSVKSQPHPMEEWTPYQYVHPPHLEGFLQSTGGQFLLVPLENGSTRVEATTWYYHHMGPVAYWQIWSDYIIHKIHLRVLTHIKKEVEGNL